MTYIVSLGYRGAVVAASLFFESHYFSGNDVALIFTVRSYLCSCLWCKSRQ